MTVRPEIVDCVVLESKMGRVGDENGGDYVRLREEGDAELGEGFGEEDACCCCSGKWTSLRWWAKVVVLCLFLLAGGAACVVFGGPWIIKKVVIPILDWEMATFSTPVLGLLLFACIALFPAMMLPSSPCMWILGMTFGYGYGFLLIMAAMSLGMSFPFFIGSLFRQRMHKWFEKWPKRAAIVRLAGEGNWLHQFRAVTLIRISPFPYLIFNYAAVATNVKYCPYICGSLVGTVPETFLTIYSGRMLRNLADATTRGEFLTVEQVIYDAVGFGIALASTVAITIYAKKALQTLQAEEELS